MNKQTVILQADSVITFNTIKITDIYVIPTITATEGWKILHYNEPYEISNTMIKFCGSYPLDYNFNNQKPKYLIGMSVPPVMTAQIATEIYTQWLSVLVGGKKNNCT